MKCEYCHAVVLKANYCIQCGHHLPKMVYPHFVPNHFVSSASHWHDGQTSALYSVSSTGYIHDKEHRILLEAELIRTNRLKSFLSWVQSLPEDEDV